MQWITIAQFATSLIVAAITAMGVIWKMGSMFSRVETKLEGIEKTVDEIKESITDVDKEVRQTQHRVVALETRIAVPGLMNGAGH